jgi:hypothetical protein
MKVYVVFRFCALHNMDCVVGVCSTREAADRMARSDGKVEPFTLDAQAA